jgi:hypothetical protein
MVKQSAYVVSWDAAALSKNTVSSCIREVKSQVKSKSSDTCHKYRPAGKQT